MMRCNLDKMLKHGDIARLSEKTGIHRNTLRKYKNEKQIPGLDHAYKISAYFNKTVYEIWPPE